jgi:phage/plasmid-like protein (TIGR03299 family)
MPAYFDTGFSVRQPMWHGEGLVLDDYPTDWNDARQKAGLEWEPELIPMFSRTPNMEHLLDETLPAYTYEEVPGYQLSARDDTHAVLGPVTDSYGLVPHGAGGMEDILEAVLGAGAKFETAGSCKGGAMVWALAYIDEPLTIAGDDTDTLPFVALLNSHDGSGACKLVATSVRVVCWNTYQAASMQGQRSGRQFVFKHTASVTARISEAKEALSGVRDEQREWVALANDLHALPIDAKALAVFVEQFIPEPENTTVRVKADRQAKRDAFTKLYLESPSTDGHRGTALGLVDAAVEWLDHVRPYRSADTYLTRTLLRPEPVKANVVRLAREVAAEFAS